MDESNQRSCWCGSQELEPFNADYSKCTACQTLVLQGPLAQADPHVQNDADDFYGWQYFNSFQQSKNKFPTLAERARTDLPERCVYWLNALTKFKMPPSRVLEIGSAHGGFVATMRQAGFDATGLDLSPAVVQVARDTFNVPMLLGPVEDQKLEPASFDAIVLMDVIEHLPHPTETLSTCMQLLKDDGVLLVQTPAYRPERSMIQLVAEQHRFIEQFRPGEHVNLFSEASAKRLCATIGAPHVEFLEPIYWFYDMFFVASRKPIQRVGEALRETSFTQSVQGRFARAALDAEDRFRSLLAKHRRMLKENERLQSELARATAQGLPRQVA